MLVLIFALIAAVGTVILLAPWRRTASYKSEATGQSALPKMSVVAFALRDEENLDAYIDTLLNQDYPDFEVILVCDASAEATAMLSDRFAGMENLHVTFIPPGSHNLSRHKLAQTIGIKAAKGEVVLTTASSVIPDSDRWLRTIAEPFADSEVDVVCGYVHPRLEDFKGISRWYRQMDGVMTSAQWMDAAIQGTPYRGDGYNLAFRRQLFFEHKGYASSLTLVDGDDDIFIHAITRKGRGRLVLNPESFVDTRWGDEASRMYVDFKDRYIFTRKYLPKRPFVQTALLEIFNWLCLGVTAFGAVTLAKIAGAMTAGGSSQMLPELIMVIAGLAIVFGAWLFEILIYRRLAARLKAVRLFWGVVPFLLWRPIGNFLFFLNHYPTRKRHYTWVRN